MTRWTLIAGLSSVLLCGSTAMAARCSGVAGIVFCDDFDRWCQDPPVDPAAQCLVTDPEDEPAFWGHWPQADGTCSVNSPYRLWTAGDAVYYKYASVKAAQNPDTQRLARHVHDTGLNFLSIVLEAQRRKTQLDGYAPCFFFGEAVRFHTGQVVNQGGLAVVDMPGRTDNKWAHPILLSLQPRQNSAGRQRPPARNPGSPTGRRCDATRSGQGTF